MSKEHHSHLAHIESFERTPIVFFTACTHGRQPLLHNPPTHTILRAMWETSGQTHGWFVGRYILMPEMAT